MTIVQNTQTDRLLRHIKKKTRVTFQGLKPSAIRGRICGPKVLLNSIPKAGTHLLERTLERYPLMRNGGRKTLAAPHTVNKKFLSIVTSVGNGEFLNAHSPFYSKLEKVLSNANIRMLFMIRDPRDIIVSSVKYVYRIDRTHTSYAYISSLPDDDTRLMAVIEGVTNIFEPIATILKKYESWMQSQVALKCRFEDLIGPLGGGRRNKQLIAIDDISRFLNIPLTEEKRESIARNIFSPKSSTFNRGIIGAWRGVFKETHKQRFKELTGDLLIRYKYEKDMKW